jgi:hypothetical protein
MEMREKIARALAADEGTYDADEMIDLVSGVSIDGEEVVPFWKLFVSKADAAIRAMRDPSPAMLNSAGNVDNFSVECCKKDAEAAHIEWWQEMIDAALSSSSNI